MFNDRLEIHKNTMEKIQHRVSWHTHYHVRRRAGEGAKIGVHPPPPLIENQYNNVIKINTFFYLWEALFTMWRPFCYLFLHMRAFLLPFSLYGGLFATFFYLWGALFTMWRPFCSLFLHVESRFCSHGGAFIGGRPCTLHAYIIILSC